MKTVIILQQGPVFTVDIGKIFNPNSWDLHLIVNKESYECLCGRNQHILFKKITIIRHFDFDILRDTISHTLINIEKTSVIISTNSENLVLVAGQLREYFSIAGLNEDIARIFSDKVFMKKHLSQFGVSLPKYLAFNRSQYLAENEIYINSISQQLSFPIIAKPIDSAGSRGVTRINDINELSQWAMSIENNSFELDEFIEGDLFHCDSFVHHGSIIHTAVCRYSSSPHKFMLGHNLGSITLPNKDTKCIKLKEFNNDILKKISPNFSGVTHLEVFEMHNGELKFLEVANRGGGAGIPRMYEKHLNIDLFSTHFLLQCSNNYTLNIKEDFYAAWLQFTPDSNMTSMESIPLIKSEICLISRNKIINKNSVCSSLRDYSLSVLLWNRSFSQLNHDFNMLAKTKTK